MLRMDNRSEIEQKLGVPLGEKGKPGPALDAFHKKGLGLHHDTVASLRRGKSSGEKVNWRLDALRALESDSASSKNLFYEQITKFGLRERRLNISRQRAHLLKSDHFVEGVAASMEQDVQVVRRNIRAMRVDLSMSEIVSANVGLVGVFLGTAKRYLDANLRTAPSARSKAVIALIQNWDYTIKGFYKSLYKVMNERGIGTWTPYEMEAFSSFYKWHDESGNKMTPFDRLVLESYMKGVPTTKVVHGIIEGTGIQIDEDVIDQHRNILVYGRPVYRSR